MTIVIMILWYLDLDLRKQIPKSGWLIPLALDVIIVVALIEINSPSCSSIGGVLGGHCQQCG